MNNFSSFFLSSLNCFGNGKENKPILITGVAGFIGSALAQELIRKGKRVIGIDNLNDYYDVNLKKSRLENLRNISIKNRLNLIFKKFQLKIKRN